MEDTVKDLRISSIYDRLAAPFPESDLEYRITRCGLKRDETVWAFFVPYVDNRAIQNRFDDVVMPWNWYNEFVSGPAGGVLCGIYLRIVGDHWIAKWDGAENTDTDPVKGGLSLAMKRSAVQWKVGRYLYLLGELQAIIGTKDNPGKYRAKLPKSLGGMPFTWSPSPLPDWAKDRSSILRIDKKTIKMLAQRMDEVGVNNLILEKLYGYKDVSELHVDRVEDFMHILDSVALASSIKVEQRHE